MNYLFLHMSYFLFLQEECRVVLISINRGKAEEPYHNSGFQLLRVILKPLNSTISFTFSIWKTWEIFLRHYYLGTLEKSYSRPCWGQVCPGKAEQQPLQLQVGMMGEAVQALSSHHLPSGLLASSAHTLSPSGHEIIPMFCYRISHSLLIKPRLSAAL